MLKNVTKLYQTKPVRYIGGIFLIGLFMAFVSAALNKAQAEDHPMIKGFPPGMLEPVMLPLYCGNSSEMITLTTMQFGMKYITSGEVRKGGQIDGDLLGTMSFWYNVEENRGVYYMTLRDAQFTCLLSYGVNLKFDIDGMLDIVNEKME